MANIAHRAVVVPRRLDLHRDARRWLLHGRVSIDVGFGLAAPRGIE